MRASLPLTAPTSRRAPSGVTASEVAKNGTAPSAVAWDEKGFLYGLDLLRHDVKVFTAKGEFVYHFGGWSTPETRGRAPGEMLYPMDLCVDPEGPIYVAERFGGRVQAFTRKLKPEPAKK